MRSLDYKDFTVTIHQEAVEGADLARWTATHPEHGEQGGYFYAADELEAFRDAVLYIDDFLGRHHSQARFKNCYTGCVDEYGLVPTMWGMAQWVDMDEWPRPLNFAVRRLALSIETQA